MPPRYSMVNNTITFLSPFPLLKGLSQRFGRAQNYLKVLWYIAALEYCYAYLYTRWEFINHFQSVRTRTFGRATFKAIKVAMELLSCLFFLYFLQENKPNTLLNSRNTMLPGRRLEEQLRNQLCGCKQRSFFLVIFGFPICT